jgi:hypothetical protein
MQLWQILCRGNKLTFRNIHLGAQIRNPRTALKIKIRPSHTWRRPQNVLEICKSLADWTKHNIQEIHVSGSSSNLSTQLGNLSLLGSHQCSGGQKTTIPSSLDYMGKFCVLCRYYTDASFKSWFYLLLGPIWCTEIFVCLNFNLQYLLCLYVLSIFVLSLILQVKRLCPITDFIILSSFRICLVFASILIVLWFYGLWPVYYAWP